MVGAARDMNWCFRSQIIVQPFLYVFADKPYHCLGGAALVIGDEGIIIPTTIRKFDIDRRIVFLHEHKI